MKKFITFALMLCAACALNAQTTLLSESFDSTTLPTGWTTVDADGDSYTWDPSAGFADSHGTSDGCISSASYINYVGALTPDNWLISPAVQITGNSDLTFYVKGVAANYAEENYSVYVATSNTVAALAATTPVLTATSTATWEQKIVGLNAYVGQTIYIAIRHHNTTNMYWLSIDDFAVVAQPTTPTVAVNPTTLTWSDIHMNSSDVQEVNVRGYVLTAGITATTAAPFSVSADNTTFGTTASLPATGGTLYVKYAPTTEGAHTGTVTLSSTGAPDATIALNGTSVNCSTIISSLPYVENFNSLQVLIPNCWGTDGSSFLRLNIDTAAGNYGLAFPESGSYLMTPEINVTPASEMRVEFKYTTYVGSNSSSTFRVGYGTTSDINAFTWIDTVTVDTDIDFTPWRGVIPSTAKYVAVQATEIGTFAYWFFTYDNYIFIDDFKITENTPAVVADQNTLNYGNVIIGNDATLSTNVSAFMLTGAITATTTAPYSISADNITFATTATLPQTGGMLYVKYTPVSAGTDAGVVVLSSTGVSNDTITMTGIALDCSQNTIPYTCNFSDANQTDCWTVVDANNDQSTFAFGNDVDDAYAVYSYNSTNAADDWMISPVFTLNGTQYVSFQYRTANTAYTEKFQVYAISTTDTVALSSVINVTDATFQTMFISLANLNGSYKIGFHCTSDADMFRLYITDFNINNTPEGGLVHTSAETIDFGITMIGAPVVSAVTVTGLALTGDITVATAAPFEVSADNTTFAATATIAAAGGTLYVRYSPTAEGTQNGTVTLTSGTANASIAVTGSAVDCSTPLSLPFNEGFEEELSQCWQNIDLDGDGYSWEAYVGEDFEDYAHTGTGFYGSASFVNYVGSLTPDNWLITPAIAIPAQGATLKWFDAPLDSEDYAEHYQVKVSTSGYDVNNFTTVFDVTLDETDYVERTVSLAQFAGQNVNIAFVHNNTTGMYVLRIDDISITEGVGVEDLKNSLNVYPNPASSIINVNAGGNIESIRIVNMAGQCVYSANAGSNNATVNVSNLSNGMYFMEVTTEAGTTTQKITVAR